MTDFTWGVLFGVGATYAFSALVFVLLTGLDRWRRKRLVEKGAERIPERRAIPWGEGQVTEVWDGPWGVGAPIAHRQHSVLVRLGELPERDQAVIIEALRGGEAE